MRGIHIQFDDRPDEWVDPVMEEREEGGQLIIDNGAYEYSYPRSHVVKTDYYDPKEPTDED